MRSPLLLATSNPAKLSELEAILRAAGLVVQSPRDIGLVLQVDENGSTFTQNATLKAESFARASECVALADDSGLEVEALGGAPGVFSARFGGPELDDAGRNRLLLDQLQRSGDAHRSARFVSVIAVAVPGRSTRTFTGRVAGRITLQCQGENGFGYDPVFLYPPFGRTFGQIAPNEKARVSHRARALRRALPYLRTLARDGILEAQTERSEQE